MSLTVRRLFPSDEQALFNAVHHSLPELSRWMPWATPDFSLETAGAFIEGANSAARMDLAITWTERLVGVCGVNQISELNRSANLGYWVRSDETGNGFGSQAARLTARRAAAERGIHRFQITMSVHNDASRKTAERLGASFEGIAKEALLLSGVFHDARIYSYFVEEPSDDYL